MTNVKVTCDCGAIYEMIETEGSSRSRSLLNVSCARRNYSRGRGLMLVSFASSGVPNSDRGD